MGKVGHHDTEEGIAKRLAGEVVHRSEIKLVCKSILSLDFMPLFLVAYINTFGGGNGNSLQCSCLRNPMDRGVWRAAVPGVPRVGHDLVTKPSILYSSLFF